MRFYKQENRSNRVVASIHAQDASFNYFDIQTNTPVQIASKSIDYTDLEQLKEAFIDWSRQSQLKNQACRWLVGRDCYQSYTVDSSLAIDEKVPEKEIRQALKWQIKDLLEHNLDDVVVNYYKPQHPDPNNQQVIVIALEKQLVESIIDISKQANLQLESIEIEELAIGQAILPELSTGKIVGYIGEDNAGLVFNFYNGEELSFSRYKKGLFIPKDQEFNLESENQDNQKFLLEIQRTMDYVISQLFRKPVDKLLIQSETLQASLDNNNFQQTKPLANMIQQFLDIPVALVSPQFTTQQNNLPQPSLAEMGIVIAGKV